MSNSSNFDIIALFVLLGLLSMTAGAVAAI